MIRLIAHGLPTAAVDHFARLGGAILGDDRPGSAALPLEVHCADGREDVPFGVDESFELHIADAGITLHAATVAGAWRGMARVLEHAHAGTLRPGNSRDAPRFPWRGLLLDVSRHFLPLESLQRTLDAMALVQLNTLHLHLSDDQGFRVESQAWPKLHELGGAGGYYRQADIRALVAYAAGLGIRVVPEFDVPAHTTSWLVGYPHLGLDPKAQHTLAATWGSQEACLDPENDAVYAFLERLFAELTGLFPDAFFHVGGDETRTQGAFQQRVHGILARLGRETVGWDEIRQPGLPRDVVIQSWRGEAAIAAIAQAGHRCVRSHGYYLDHLLPADAHAGIDPLDGTAELTAAERARVLGGEACMWTEYADVRNLDNRIWPRAAVIADRLWGRDDDLDARLVRVSELLERVGLQHVAVYEEALTTLAADRDVAPLRAIVDTLAPAPPFRDGDFGRQTDAATPLTALVDAVPTDNPVARRFARAVRAGDRATIRATLRTWSTADVAFDESYAGTPAHSILAPHAAALATMARAALAGAQELPAPVTHADLESRVRDSIVALSDRGRAS